MSNIERDDKKAGVRRAKARSNASSCRMIRQKGEGRRAKEQIEFAG